MRYTIEESEIIDFVINEEYDKLLEYDIADDMGNFFNINSFSSKINGLIIAYGYHLKRVNETDKLIAYELNDV